MAPPLPAGRLADRPSTRRASLVARRENANLYSGALSDEIESQQYIEGISPPGSLLLDRPKKKRTSGSGLLRSVLAPISVNEKSPLSTSSSEASGSGSSASCDRKRSASPPEGFDELPTESQMIANTLNDDEFGPAAFEGKYDVDQVTRHVMASKFSSSSALQHEVEQIKIVSDELSQLVHLDVNDFDRVELSEIKARVEKLELLVAALSAAHTRFAHNARIRL